MVPPSFSLSMKSLQGGRHPVTSYSKTDTLCRCQKCLYHSVLTVVAISILVVKKALALAYLLCKGLVELFYVGYPHAKKQTNKQTQQYL